MKVELVPDPGPGDPFARAALEALAGQGLTGDPGPATVSGAWQRAGRAEALRCEIGPERPPVRGVVPPPRHAGARAG